MSDRNFVKLPGEPCGEKVLSGDFLLGFCEKELGHGGSHTHLTSEYRVWWEDDRFRR